MTGPGRPTTGVRVDIRIPAADLAVVDTFAEVNGLNRAEALRQVVGMWVESLDRQNDNNPLEPGVNHGPTNSR